MPTPISLPELDCKTHRVAGRKTTASKALAALSPIEVMSELYQIVYQIYLRKLQGIVPQLGVKSKDNSSLNKLCDALNVSPDESVATLLARLRALDIVRRPA